MSPKHSCFNCKKFYFGFGNIWNNNTYCKDCVGLVQFKSYFNYIRSSPSLKPILKPKNEFENIHKKFQNLNLQNNK